MLYGYNHRSIRAAIEAELARVKGLDRGAGYATYVMRNPRKADPRDPDKGMPIYVGQTKQLATRVARRFANAEDKGRRSDNIDRLITTLFRQDAVPTFDVVDWTETRLASLVSETNWVRHFRNDGYDLKNKASEHKTGGPPIGRHDVPKERLWKFSIQEAIADNITIKLQCRKCDLDLPPVDLAAFQSTADPPSRDLFGIREREGLSCPSCGATGRSWVKIVVGD